MRNRGLYRYKRSIDNFRRTRILNHSLRRLGLYGIIIRSNFYELDI